ncbi:RecX family transcriptional regulator [bacterium]|nr:RecX family transcriptional regulator [bacterium]
MSKRKIIEIKPQVRNPQRKTLVFDDGGVFGISEDVFISHNFTIGSELSDDSFNKLLDDELKVKVYNSALRLLGYRMRSCAEMKQRLAEKKYPKNIIEETIDKLLKIGYLNDTEFAEAFANDKVKSKKLGPMALRIEFIPHKIESGVLEKTINLVYKKYPISDLIKQLLDKKKIQSETKLDQKIKKRIYDLLTRKGFNWDEISTVLTELEIT